MKIKTAITRDELHLEKVNRQVVNSVLKEIESLIESDVFYNMGWDEPEMMEDLGCDYDRDDMLTALELAREIVCNRRKLYLGVINE